MPRPQVIASHLNFMGYAHWLANDLRGSGSTELRSPALKTLGPVHFGTPTRPAPTR